MKTEFQKKKEAKQQAALELHKTKARLGLGRTQPLRGAEETQATVKEIRRKARQIAPAYNKGALQYLPDGKDKCRG